LESRHGGTNPELACFVVARRQYPSTISRAADRNRFTSQFRVIADFDRRVETIHVEMDDLPGHSGS
jgi:hypothetical protein